jgi:hypothetical protein
MFVLLMIRRAVVSIFIFCSSIAFTRNHFLIKFIVGGIPPRFLIKINGRDLLIFLKILGIAVFLLFIVIIMTGSNEIQYKDENTSMVFRFVVVEDRIHLMLKTDE